MKKDLDNNRVFVSLRGQVSFGVGVPFFAFPPKKVENERIEDLHVDPEGSGLGSLRNSAKSRRRSDATATSEAVHAVVPLRLFLAVAKHAAQLLSN